MKTLIIVDVQHDFIPGGALEVPKGDQIITQINSLQENFDLVVATQDWHPKNHKSFASSHPDKKSFDKILLNGLEQVLWPDHCIQGTSGAMFHRELNMNKVEAIFRKGTDKEIDSYSGFYDNGHRKSTGLAGYLREREAKTVYVCGLAGDYCVYYTARDAIREGFDTCIIEDATKSLSQSDFESAKKEIRRMGGSIVTGGEVLR